MGGLFEDKDHAEATASTTTTDRKKMKKTTKGATIIKGAEGGRIGIAIHELGQNNVKNTPTKEEETEREKKLNQRLYTVQDKEEEDGVKDTGRSQREEHNEGC